MQYAGLRTKLNKRGGVFYDMGIPEVFDPTGLIPKMALAKPTQTHTSQIWGGFKHKKWGENPHLMPLHNSQVGKKRGS